MKIRQNPPERNKHSSAVQINSSQARRGQYSDLLVIQSGGLIGSEEKEAVVANPLLLFLKRSGLSDIYLSCNTLAVLQPVCQPMGGKPRLDEALATFPFQKFPLKLSVMARLQA